MMSRQVSGRRKTARGIKKKKRKENREQNRRECANVPVRSCGSVDSKCS